MTDIFGLQFDHDHDTAKKTRRTEHTSHIYHQTPVNSFHFWVYEHRIVTTYHDAIRDRVNQKNDLINNSKTVERMESSRQSTGTRGERRESLENRVARREKGSPHEACEPFSTPSSKRRKSPPNSSAKKIPVPPFHPTSKWQEPDREDGLALYEWHRKARPVLSGRIERPIDSVLQCFRCAICLETICKAVVVECLHRFCEQCIGRALRAGPAAGQCPICRIPISTRRKISRDHEFDRLVESIVGRICAEDGPVNNNSSMAAATLQRAILRKRTEQSKSSIQNISLLSCSGGASVIDFALFRYKADGFDNQLDPLNFPYIRTQDTVMVYVIKAFLKRKLNLDPHLMIQLMALVAGSKEHAVLDDGLSLGSIASRSSQDSEILELFYRLDPKKRTKK